ncbi:unnamed protein product, partial [Amoebophrya sp. A25]|eukprot:GSA25T00021016001.1
MNDDGEGPEGTAEETTATQSPEEAVFHTLFLPTALPSRGDAEPAGGQFWEFLSTFLVQKREEVNSWGEGKGRGSILTG